jgi:hypothetical protein
MEITEILTLNSPQVNDRLMDLRVKICRGLGVSEKIPKGFRHSAQRCHDEAGATLGGESEIEINPNGVVADCQEHDLQVRAS